MGPGTLCNACGLRYRSGRLAPEHRPAVSRTFWLTQRTNSHGEAALSGSRLPNKRSRLSRTSSAALICNNSPASKGAGPVDAKGGRRGARRQCTHCAPEKTPQWRVGPLGPQTLCKACRVRYKPGQPVPEYGPAANPTFLLTQHSNSHKRAAISCSRSKNKRLKPPRTSLVASNEELRPTEAKGSRARAKARQRCVQCASEKTPQWRAGPMGPRTLCNACGMQYRLRRLVPEYKPAASPTFVSTQHSNRTRR